MVEQSKAAEKVAVLTKRLESSQTLIKELEQQFESHSVIQNQLIARLSLVCKGIDLELDNKLAKFRQLLASKPNIIALEPAANKLSNVLSKQTKKNALNVSKVQKELINACSELQNSKGLPNQVRRDLRELIEDINESQDSIFNYTPMFQNILDLYQQTLASKAEQGSTGLLNQYKEQKGGNSLPEENVQNLSEISNQFAALLAEISLSGKFGLKLEEIRSQLSSNPSSELLLDTFIKTFELIITGLRLERESAESFLYSLNDALTKIHRSLESSFKSSNDAHSEHQEINNKLQAQLNEMSEVVESATDLDQLKGAINGKLSNIASSIELKSNIEDKTLEQLTTELTKLKERVNTVEQEAKSYKDSLAEQKIKNLQDSLTKLPNRAAFDERLKHEIQRCRKEKSDLAIAVLDLDYFKRINDTYGHIAGDKTLQVIAKSLAKAITGKNFVARYGGEEFVIILPELDKEKALALLNQLRLQIAKLPFKFKNKNVSITISIGVTHIINEDNEHTAFERADKGLYQAKEQGRNQVIYT